MSEGGNNNNDKKNKKTKGQMYGSTSETKAEHLTNQSVLESNNAMRISMIEDMHESFISQIRLQSQNTDGPIMANFQIPRSRRRPMLRTKSESDFGALVDEDVEEMRNKLIRRYGNGHHKVYPIKSVPKLTKNQKFVLASIALVDFTSFCAMAILAPFYPSEAAKKNVPTAISGFVFSVYALVVFLSSPLMGIVVTHVGPKFMLIVGIILGGFCNILFGLLDKIDDMTTFIGYCFAVRIFEAVGAAMIATSCYTFVAQIFPDNIGSVLGILEIFVGLGLSVGPAIGGLLYDWGGYGLPFFSLGIVMLLTIPLNAYLLPSSELDEDPSLNNNGGMVKLIKLPPVAIVCVVIIVVSNTWGFLDPTLEPHLREFNLSAKQLGLFFLLSSLLYAVSSPFWGWLADKMVHTWILMVVGLLLSAFGLLLLGPAPLIGLTNSIWLNIVALAILGTSVSMALLPTFEAILDFAIEGGYKDDISTYGVIAGLWSSMYSLGEVIGPSLGGFLLQNYGFPICATVMAGMCLTVALLVLIYFLSFHPVVNTESSVDSREKITEVSDSGISENGRVTSSSSSSSSLCAQIVPVVLVNENTPLISKSLNGNTSDPFLNRLMTESSTVGNKATTDPQNVPNANQHNEGFSSGEYPGYSFSFPKVLKNVGITEFGACEV